jgi:hypothetical protein
MNKEKKKSHPFATHLRETEEILWISAESNVISRQRALRMTIGLDIIFTVFIILMIAIRGYFSDFEIMAVISIALVSLVLVAPIAAIMVFFVIRTQNRTRQIYAVTNERLLHRMEGDVKTIALEALPPISVFQSDHSKGTLSFGPFFPMWPDVENAATVKKIIEDAKAQRTVNL